MWLNWVAVAAGLQGTEVDTTKPEYDEEIQSRIAAADAARTVHTQANSDKNAVDSKIKTLEEELGHDWGPDSAFAYMIGQCYDAEVENKCVACCGEDPLRRPNARAEAAAAHAVRPRIQVCIQDLPFYERQAGPKEWRFYKSRQLQGLRW